MPIIALLIALTGSGATVQDSCPSAPILPAYAHNDYRNARPLRDALALGYRGVEADVFRAGTELIVGHERATLRRANTLVRLYLEPLRERLRSCGRVLADSTPFLLSIELKEADTTAFRYLVAQLRQFEELFVAPRRSVQITLVGWWPSRVPGRWPEYVRVHAPVGRGVARALDGASVGFVSIDYGRVLGWSGRGTIPARARQQLAAARLSAETLGVPLRVHHVPVNAAVYDWLLSQGITLIGTDDLKRSRAILVRPRPDT